ASAFDFTVTMAYPSMSPFLSVNGPSLTANFPELIRTRAPFALGSKPSVPRSTPACAISCTSFPTASISFGEGGWFVSGFPDLYSSTNLMRSLPSRWPASRDQSALSMCDYLCARTIWEELTHELVPRKEPAHAGQAVRMRRGRRAG